MTKKVRQKLETVRGAMHDAIKDLNKSETKELLEELSVDVDGNLDAIGAEGDTSDE